MDSWSDVEMLGSPAAEMPFPKIKNENDDEREVDNKTVCVVLREIEVLEDQDNAEGDSEVQEDEADEKEGKVQQDEAGEESDDEDQEDEENDDVQEHEAEDGNVEKDNVENGDADKDPMNLLQPLGKGDPDNEEQELSITVDDSEVSHGKEDSNVEKPTNGDESNNEESSNDESSDKESEKEDPTYGNRSKNKVLRKRSLDVIKETPADKQNPKQIANALETTPWMCRIENDSERVFCVYCNVLLIQKSAPKHEFTQLHKERATEYLDFVDNAEGDFIRIKTNKDYDGDIPKEREKVENLYADYVWNLWLKSHDWLERHKETGYIGYCKTCSVELNVSVAHLRKFHEESNKHKNRGVKSQQPKRRKTVSGDAMSADSEHSNASTDKISEKSIEVKKPFASAKDVPDPTQNEYFEKSRSSADLCRCKLCDITMFTTSFFRHSTSNLHKQNLAVLDNPRVPDNIEKPQWLTFQALHPWLTEDPNNPMEAYCKYCEKRITHGASAAKRLIHEHSAPHKAAFKKYAGAEAAKAKQAANASAKQEESEEENDEEDESSENGEVEEADDDEDNQDDDEIESEDNEENESEDKSENDTTSEAETESSQTKTKATERPSCMKYLRGGKYARCSYCKVKIQSLSKTIRIHLESQRHKNKAIVFKRRSKASKRGRSSKSKAKDPPTHTLSPALTAAVARPEHPWLVKFKSNPDVVFCKYCRFRFSAKANRNYHAMTKRHIEAAEKFENKSTEKQKEAAVMPEPLPPPPAISVAVKYPVATAKIVPKKKFTQTQLKSMFDWLSFKKGMQTNYGYCTFCQKPIYIPSPKFGNKHKRSGFHARARNEIKRQEEQKQEEQKQEKQKQEKPKISELLKRTRIDSDIDKEKENTPSEKSSEGPPPKRFRPNSLQTAIETAKRLSSIHLEMLTFMRNNGRTVPKITNATLAASSCEPETSKTETANTSAIAELNATLSPIVYAATQASKRDPFDLFCNSVSESIKVLPPDLASEAKLKIMQTMFDLETRAQQRVNLQPEQELQQQEQQLPQRQSPQQTLPQHPLPQKSLPQQPLPQQALPQQLSQQPLPQQLSQQPLPQQLSQQPLPQQLSQQPLPQQLSQQPLPQQLSQQPLPQQLSQQPLPQQKLQQKREERINASVTILNENGNVSSSPSPELIISEPIPVRVQQRPQQLQQSQPTSRAILPQQTTYTVSTTSTPSNSGGPRKFFIQQTPSGNSSNTQQHHAVSTSTPQANSNSAQRNSVVKITAANQQPIQANTIVHAQRKMQHNSQVQQAAPQNVPQTSAQRETLMRHRIVTNQLNNLVSNVNQRMNVNNTSMTIKPHAGLTISAVNSLVADSQNSGSSARTTGQNNRQPQIRTVPLSSLTKAKYQTSASDQEPAFHQIQLNSSTQSKIITLDPNNYHRR